MNKDYFNSLSLQDKEKLIMQQGKLVGAEDGYSYRLIYYNVDDKFLELMYDNETDLLISITFSEDISIEPNTQVLE